MGILDTLHSEHKARQLRLKKAAFKAVMTELPPPPPEPEVSSGPAPYSPQKIYNNTFDATWYEVCTYYDVREKDVFSNRHQPSVVRCRHIIAYILYDITSMTNPAIGRRMDRDPTSILHAINKIKNGMAIFGPAIKEIERRIALHSQK
jgi:hypothetical protein